MKKIQTMMLMLLVAVMGLTVQSCGSDKTETYVVTYMYVRQPLNNLTYHGKVVSTLTETEVASDQVLIQFAAALNLADESMKTASEGSDDTVMNIYRNALASFTSGKGFSGYLLITKKRVDGTGSEQEAGRILFTE